MRGLDIEGKIGENRIVSCCYSPALPELGTLALRAFSAFWLWSRDLLKKRLSCRSLAETRSLAKPFAADRNN
jgi:hypothetical protein